MLRGADITNHNRSHVDSDAELAQSVVSYSDFLGFSHNSERATATLCGHIATVKHGHETVATKLVHITAKVINQLHLHGETGADLREQLTRLQLFGQGCKSTNVSE